MITYWIRATQENANLMGNASFVSNEQDVFVVSQEGTYRGVSGPFSEGYKQNIIKNLPEYKYHEKTKQFIPANSKLFEEQEESVVKEDFKIEVGTVALVQETQFMTVEERKLINERVEVLSKFEFADVEKVVIFVKGRGLFIVDRAMLRKPLSDHELKVKQVVKQYTPAIEVISSDFGVTPEELAEFLISKQNNQETK